MDNAPQIASGPQSMLSSFQQPIWLFVRLILGVEWVRAGWEKIGDPGWTASPTGAAVEGFLNGAVAKSTEGPHPEVPHWFHNLINDAFFPNTELFAYLVAYGELLVGIAILAGVLTRFAALGGVVMNLTFLWSGVTSTNPPLLLLGLGVVIFGGSAGMIGLDRWIVPIVRRNAPDLLRTLSTVAVVSLAALAVALLGLAATAESLWLWWVAAAVATIAAGARYGSLKRNPDEHPPQA